ncbi:MAG: hypothetical protein ACI9WT_000475, partial [Flavobacterium sp.]
YNQQNIGISYLTKKQFINRFIYSKFMASFYKLQL